MAAFEKQMTGDEIIEKAEQMAGDMDKIEVIDADREAAASVAVLAEMRELIRAGKADHHAEPFAKHRIAALEAQAREIERLREALDKDVSRFERCADMISDGGNPSGTLRVERFLQAKQYATEARAALKGE